jgi:hypothetical protein
MTRLSDRAEAALGFLLAFLIGLSIALTLVYWWSCSVC